MRNASRGARSHGDRTERIRSRTTLGMLSRVVSRLSQSVRQRRQAPQGTEDFRGWVVEQRRLGQFERTNPNSGAQRRERLKPLDAT